MSVIDTPLLAASTFTSRCIVAGIRTFISLSLFAMWDIIPHCVPLARCDRLPSMQTPPPYQVNFSISAGRLSPLPQALWVYFCDKATAMSMLKSCEAIDPHAVLVDVIRDKTLPDGAYRLPFPQIESTDPTSDVSCYQIVGTVALKGGAAALLAEFAGWLADALSGAEVDPLDVQAQNIAHGGKSRLFAYVSPYDPADSDCYWADAPVLGGMAL